MCNIVHGYFSNLFAGDTVEEVAGDSASPRQVTDEENLMLCGELQFEEFSDAIKQMHPDKSSGPDGLNPAFYQSFWSVMGREVFDCCKQWLTTCSFPFDLNSTNVVLIDLQGILNIACSSLVYCRPKTCTFQSQALNSG